MTARLEPKRVKGKASCRPIQKELNDNPYFINQINYHNEEFIIVCVGSGGAGADGV